MNATGVGMRRVAVVSVAVASIAAALAAAWHVTGSGALGRVPTPLLLGLVGLFVLPAATLAAWRGGGADSPSSPPGREPRGPIDAPSAQEHDEPAAPPGGDPGNSPRSARTHRRRARHARRAR